MRLICSACDYEWPARKSPKDWADIRYTPKEACPKCSSRAKPGSGELTTGEPERSYRAIIPPGKIGVTGFEEIKKP